MGGNIGANEEGRPLLPWSALAVRGCRNGAKSQVDALSSTVHPQANIRQEKDNCVVTGSVLLPFRVPRKHRVLIPRVLALFDKYKGEVGEIGVLHKKQSNGNEKVR